MRPESVNRDKAIYQLTKIDKIQLLWIFLWLGCILIVTIPSLVREITMDQNNAQLILIPNSNIGTLSTFVRKYVSQPNRPLKEQQHFAFVRFSVPLCGCCVGSTFSGHFLWNVEHHHSSRYCTAAAHSSRERWGCWSGCGCGVLFNRLVITLWMITRALLSPCCGRGGSRTGLGARCGALADWMYYWGLFMKGSLAVTVLVDLASVG